MAKHCLHAATAKAIDKGRIMCLEKGRKVPIKGGKCTYDSCSCKRK